MRLPLSILLLCGACPYVLAACTRPLPEPEDRTPIALDAVPVAYYIGTRKRDTIAISEEHWAEIRSLFQPPADRSLIERHQIRAAIARFEQIAGEQTPVKYDLRKNKVNPAHAGRTDCIDESTNTMTWLLLLEQEGLLRWHRVAQKVFRGPLQLDTHFSAQIQELETGEHFVVDSWYLDNGCPPFIQRTADWLAKRDFCPAENPGAPHVRQ